MSDLILQKNVIEVTKANGGLDKLSMDNHSSQLGLLNDHLFGKELFFRFTVRVFRERLSGCVVPLSFLVLRVECRN